MSKDSRLNKMLLEKGKAFALKTENKDAPSEDDPERLSDEDVEREFREYIKKNPNSKVARTASQKAIFLEESYGEEGFTDEELSRELENLKRNRPQLFRSIYEDARAEQVRSKHAFSRLIKKSITGYIILALTAVPFALDIIRGTYSTATDYKFVLMAAGLLFFGPLRKLRIQYKLACFVAFLWININPLFASYVKTYGLLKYIVEAVAITVCFLLVETVSNVVIGGGGASSRGEEPSTLGNWIRGVIALVIAASIFYLIYYGPGNIIGVLNEVYLKVSYKVAGIIGR